MKRKRKKKVKADGKRRLMRSNCEKWNRTSLSGLDVNDETCGMLKAGNVERKSLSKGRSESCDVVNGIQAKQDKTSASKNENRTSV